MEVIEFLRDNLLSAAMTAFAVGMVVSAWLSTRCKHQWKQVSAGPYQWEGLFTKGQCTRYTVRCTKCGRISYFNS